MAIQLRLFLFIYILHKERLHMTIKECKNLKPGNIITMNAGEFEGEPMVVEEVCFFKELTQCKECRAARIEAKILNTGEPINVYYRNAVLLDSYSLILSEDECYCSVVELYELVAREFLKKSLLSGQFDCKKICVTPGVIDILYKYYETEKHLTRTEVTTLLLIYGPKGNLEAPMNKQYAAKLEDGFYVEE